jgi:Fe-S cluster assembly protein SufD
VTTDTQLQTSFTRAAVERLAAARDEPLWLREMRLAAFDAFERLPWPTERDRAWKYFDPRRLRLDGLLPYAGYDGAPARDVQALARAPETLAGLVVQQDSETAAVELSDEVRRQGVIVESLDAAVRDHEDLVRRYLLNRVVRPDESVFTALHAAFWTGGAFVYVPRDVAVALPLQVAFVQQAADAALFPHLLVVLERGATLTLVEERIGAGEAGGFVAGVTEFMLADEAELKHYAVQRWSPRTQDVSVQRALLGKDAKATRLVAGLGGELQKWWVDALMQGSGAESTMLGVFFGTGAQHMDVITLQDHIGPHTTSDLLYKSALKDRAVGAYYGLTRVGPEARGTAANQEDRNLLLSPRAKADADPVLEIMTSDVVRCGHGASAGPVDPEQLFYLETRGLPRPAAEKLLVQGFLHQVLDRIPLDPVVRTIERTIDEKLEAGA